MSLQVNVLNANLTIDDDTFGKMDPYAIVYVGHNHFRTQTINGGGMNVQWNESTQFQYQGEQQIKVVVKDSDMLIDDKVGEGVAFLPQLYPGQQVPITVQLHSGQNFRGSVQLSVILN